MKVNDDISVVIKSLVEMGETDQGRDYFEIVHAIALILPQQLHEQLRQLVNGPIWDGDVVSKSDRGWLFRMGLAIRVCCKGEQGHTGAKYIAYSVVKKLKEMKLADANRQRAADHFPALREPDEQFTKQQNAKIDAHIIQRESDPLN